jgi:hypothetical protein
MLLHRFIVLLFLISYNINYGQSINKLLKNTQVLNNDFKTTIEIETIGNSIILKPIIKGKQYRFLFDTGAVSTISKKLMFDLDLRHYTKAKVEDINAKSNKLSFVNIDTLKLNELTFLNIGAAVLESDQSQGLECLNIDGILGSNAFSKIILEIDYQSKTITFTDNKKKLNIPSYAYVTKLYIGYANIPSITTYIGKEKIYNTVIDYGFGAGIYYEPAIYKSISKKGSVIKSIEGYGSTMTGIYGDNNKHHFNIATVQEYSIGNMQNTKQIINFSSNISSRTIGAGFLSNYKVTIDWKGKMIYLIEQKHEKKELIGFGYDIVLKNNNIYINYIIKNSPADKAGLKVGDTILRKNNKNYTDISDLDWCNELSDNSSNQIQLLIKRGNILLETTLNRESLLKL